MRTQTMLETPQFHSSAYWRSKAREARMIADGLATEANREQLLDVAGNYERLAEEAEQEDVHLRA
jgi:hypothetical protein